MDQLNMSRGMWPSDGSVAAVGPTAVAAPPQPFAQPIAQPMAQQLVFTYTSGGRGCRGGWGRDYEHD